VSVGLYMDVHVPAAITRALRRCGLAVLTAQEDGASRCTDPDLLDRAAKLNRIVFTRDSDFLAEGVRRQRAQLPFAIVYAHQQHVSIGRCVSDLQIIALASTPEEAVGQIIYLPLS
jgi:predicted nuclease of predicted toxin-antitoxin system